MAESDFTVLTGSLSAASVDRAVTAGATPPPGGGSFVYGFNSLDTTEGAVGLFCNLANFAPMAKGGSVSMAMKRGVSGGLTNFAPFIFIGLGTTTTTGVAYMLGLSDTDASKITLRKGTLATGVPHRDITTPPTDGVLRRSDAAFAMDAWVHLRLDMVVNDNGDVILNAFQNVLATNNVDAPAWTAIPGVAQFIDDALGVNSGSAPLTSGRAGWGFYTKDVTRRAYFDHFTLTRQT